MTALSWIATVVAAFLCGAVTTLYVGIAWFKRWTKRQADEIVEMGNQSLERITEMRSTIQ